MELFYSDFWKDDYVVQIACKRTSPTPQCPYLIRRRHSLSAIPFPRRRVRHIPPTVDSFETTSSLSTCPVEAHAYLGQKIVDWHHRRIDCFAATQGTKHRATPDSVWKETTIPCALFSQNRNSN